MHPKRICIWVGSLVDKSEQSSLLFQGPLPHEISRNPRRFRQL